MIKNLGYVQNHSNNLQHNSIKVGLYSYTYTGGEGEPIHSLNLKHSIILVAIRSSFDKFPFYMEKVEHLGPIIGEDNDQE